MKLHIPVLTTLVAWLLPLSAGATVGEVFTYNVTATSTSGTSSVPVTFQILSETPPTVQVGNGNNACISQYTAGSMTLPSTVIRYSRPYTVVRVSDWAFRLCNKLTNVAFSEGLTEVGEFVFSGCSSLRTVTLPKTVTTIGSGALNGCDALTMLTVNNPTPPTLGYIDPFDRSNTNATLLVPYRSSAAYLSQTTRGMRVWYWWFSTVAEQPSPYQDGDIDEDGFVDTNDIALLVGVILGDYPADTFEGRADLDHDGLATVSDLSIVVAKVLGD